MITVWISYKFKPKRRRDRGNVNDAELKALEEHWRKRKESRSWMIIKEGERIDELQRNGYRIIQKTNGFCFGSWTRCFCPGFASVKPGEKALDLGTGTGIIPILLEAKTEGSHFTGLEIQAEMAEMASRSVALNRLEEKVSIVQGDIKEVPTLFEKASFDVVTTNPPYMNDSHG